MYARRNGFEQVQCKKKKKTGKEGNIKYERKVERNARGCINETRKQC